MPPLILASTSRYRRELLERLGLPFSVERPDCDESQLPGETAEQLVSRLSLQKAGSVASRLEVGLVIGSDQVASVNGKVLGKSGSPERAEAQLHMLSGQRVVFHTGLCLLNTETGSRSTGVVPYTVTFRALEDAEIKRYVTAEDPVDCAGSFKSEGLGISLFEKMEGDDPTALIGLPLIRLSSMLRTEGVALP